MFPPKASMTESLVYAADKNPPGPVSLWFPSMLCMLEFFPTVH